MDGAKPPLRRSDSIDRQFAAILANAQKQYADSKGLDLQGYMEPPMRSTDDLLNVITRENEKFQTFREKRQTLFECLSAACKPLEVVGEALAGASEEVFPPGQTIFAAVAYLINAAKDVSACYDSIIELFDQMKDFTARLKSYVSQKMSSELHDKVATILATIFEIFVLAAHEIRGGRFKSYLKNLFGKESKVPEALKKLASLTQAEERLVIAETSASVKRSLSNEEKLLEMMSRVDINVQTLRPETRVPQTREQALSSNRDKLKRILRPSVYPEDNYSALDRTRTPGTCEWILQDPSLQAWMTGEIRFLWISGNPGTGKSYLASRLVSWGQEKLNDEQANSMLGYVFVRQNIPESRSMIRALKDMAYQISEQDVFYGKQLVQSISSSDEIKTVSSAFRKLLVEPCKPDKWKRHIYLLVDGLDEAEPREVREFLSLLKALKSQRATGTRVQVALVGRNTLTDDVQEAIGDDTIGRSLHVIPERNGADIVSYITEGVNRARILRRSPRKEKEDIIDAMIKQVDGLFVLAKFMLTEINRNRHPRNIVESLKAYPKEMNGMLTKAVLDFSASITPQDADDLNEILRWVSVAEMGLTLEQIESILALKMGDAPLGLEELLRGQFSCFFTLEREDGLSTADLARKHENRRLWASSETGINEENSPDPLNMERDIQYLSNKHTTYVNFFHDSVREFFQEDSSTDLRVDEEHPSIGFQLADARRHVLKTCLRIFTDPAYFVLGEEGLSLQRYAAWYWQEHLDDIDIAATPVAEKADIGSRVYLMLTDPTIILTWTNLFEESLDIWNDHNIEVVSRWLKDDEATSALTPEQKKWTESASDNPAKLLEPMGRTFAKAWLLEEFEVYMPTLFCFGVVQSLPLLERGGKWSDSDYHWQDVPLEMRIEQAAAWASQPPTGHWLRRIGSTLLNLGEHTKALEYFEEAFKKDSNTAESYGRMGLCHAMNGNYKKALPLHQECESLEKTRMAEGYYKTDHEVKAAKWRLYKNQAQIAECYNRMGDIDESIQYCRKAMENVYYAPEFEPEIAYIGVLTENNRFQEMMSLFDEMDCRYTDKGNSCFVHFLLTQIPDQSIKDWFPQAAARTGKTAVSKLAGRYRIAMESAHEAQDSWKEIYLQNAHSNILMAAQDYDNVITMLEKVCLVEYKARGSLSVRVEYIASFKQLARAYFLKAQDADQTLQSGVVEFWVKKLEKLMQQQRKYQNKDVPLRMAGFDSNEASIFLILAYRLRNRVKESRQLVQGLVSESLKLLEDDEPQNDEISIRHLRRSLIAAGDEVNARAIWQSTRPPSLPANFSGRLTTNRRQSNSPRNGGLSPRRRSKQIFLTNMFSEGNDISCDHCLKRFEPSNQFAVCWYCIDLKFCLPCLDVIKSQNFKPGHTSVCKPSHDWLIVPPLSRDLQASEILVDGEVRRLEEWKSELRDKWVQAKPVKGLEIMLN
ncbi:NACHT and TPR domain-containing protein [Colletotrichum orchidophilum]|uniref:NACHT and TPR domain-containing protein n=1 Tax=Colletotrichum orchidophilum TaxID=1209926 RepID=A0A1G4BBC9_9PEZI|nr:NACHT and TPR domain-containing protein [Colletotrichum orchidophilum]OHE98612.1 NACHT and TPR domain-containing protein [Colletotrichum orchidophilum]